MTDLYTEAARIVDRANSKEGSLKTLVYSSSYRNLRQLFALVSECVKYQSILKAILSQCGSSMLNEELIDNDHTLAVVFLYELLVGNGFGRAGFVRKVMRKYKAEIKGAHAAFLEEKNASSLAEVLKATSNEANAIPRYARVNMIKCTVKEAIDKICEEGWEYVGNLDVDKFRESVAALEEAQFGSDPILEDILVFPIHTDLHNHSMVTDGYLVLQDRASCVPAYVLNPSPGAIVMDCCAAPGNKTSHLASLMRDQGRIIALDRDARRMTTMKSLLQRSGTSCVEMIVQDFLTLSPQSEEVADITMILVDPSCSGSGMPGSRLSAADGVANPNRLQTLKRFQISLLKHALRFPAVQKVVYSTCSIYQQENEEVVEEVMSNVSRHFQFVPVFPDWPDSRGLEKFEHHKNFLRLSSEKHLTTGFFVACFEKRKVIKTESGKQKMEKVTRSEGDREGCDGIGENENSKSVCELSDEKDIEKVEDNDQVTDSGSKKKKKKSKKMEEDDHSSDETKNHISVEPEEKAMTSCMSPMESENSESKRNKKHKRENDVECVDKETDFDQSLQSKPGKKKKRKDKEKCDFRDKNVVDDDGDGENLSRKKKKKRCESEENNLSENSVSVGDQSPHKKRKRKHKEIREHDVGTECDNVDGGCLDIEQKHQKDPSSHKSKTKSKKTESRRLEKEEAKRCDDGDENKDSKLTSELDNSQDIEKVESGGQFTNKKSKKKKKKDNNEFTDDKEFVVCEDEENLSKKKKKKKRRKETDD